MSKAGRSYSDQSYGSEKVLRSKTTASLAGTGAAATVDIHTFMFPAVVSDFGVTVITGGTAGNSPITIGRSVAGTGAVTVIGTLTLGTNADGTVVDGTTTATAFSTGDDLVFQRGIATTAGPFVVIIDAKYREVFEAGDN